MKDKNLMVAIVVFFAIGFPSLILSYFITNNIFIINATRFGIGICNLLCLILLFKNGTLINSKLKYLVFLGFILFGIGINIYKEQPSNSYTLYLILSIIFIIVSYTIHFFLKKEKTILDFLKIGWVNGNIIYLVLHIKYDISVYFTIIPQIFLWTATIIYIENSYKKHKDDTNLLDGFLDNITP